MIGRQAGLRRARECPRARSVRPRHAPVRDPGHRRHIIWELSNDVWEDGKSIIKALCLASGNPVPEFSPVTDPPVPVASFYLWDSLGFLGHAAGPLQFQDDGTKDNGMRQFSAWLWRRRAVEPLGDNDPKSIGGFALVCRIGAGGMGQVYLGESAAGHQAAVKVIKVSVLDEDTRARFLSEVDSMRTVYGPFVAGFVGADAAAEQPWLAVEYDPGPDLRTYVAGHDRNNDHADNPSRQTRLQY